MKSFGFASTIVSIFCVLLFACTFVTAAPIEAGIARVIAQNHNMACTLHYCGMNGRPMHHNVGNNEEPRPDAIIGSYSQPGLFDSSDSPSFTAFFPSLSSLSSFEFSSLTTTEWVLDAVIFSAAAFIVYCLARFVRGGLRGAWRRGGDYEVVVSKW